MKKSKLIKLLSSLEGDPDIVLWNGMVGDWMDISPKLTEGLLVKETLKGYLQSVAMEKRRDLNDFDVELTPDEVEECEVDYKREKFDWEIGEFVSDEAIAEGHYKEKRVVFLDAKPRGVDTWDRLGKISY